MPMKFTLDDGSSGRLHVGRHKNTITFQAVNPCWATTTDVRKLIAELDELCNTIDSEA